MGLFSAFSRIFRGIKMSVESTLLMPFRDKADNLRKKSPEFAMFLDSKLGSPIEVATKKIWADTILNDVREFLPKYRITQAVASVWGNTIGDKAGRIMDRKKLKDHYKKGWISVEEYAEKRATQIQANFVNRLKRPIMNTRELMKQMGFGKALDKFDEFTKPVRDKIKKIAEPITDFAAEKTKNLLEKGITTFQNGIREIKQFGDSIKENIAVPVVKKAAELVGIPSSAAEEFARHPVETIKRGIKKVWKKIFG